jgi:hypothetical protein
MSVFTHPLHRDDLFILLFDRHFDSVGYQIDYDTLQEGEDSIESPEDREENVVMFGVSEAEEGTEEGDNSPLVLLDMIPAYENLVSANSNMYMPQLSFDADPSEFETALPFFNNVVTGFYFNQLARLWVITHEPAPPDTVYLGRLVIFLVIL